MRIKKTSCYALAAMLLLAYSCKKEDTRCGVYKKRWIYERAVKRNGNVNIDSIPILTLDTAIIKSITGFVVGSYWIYEEKNTGARDTVKLVQLYDKTLEYKGESDHEPFQKQYPCDVTKYYAEEKNAELTSSYYGDFKDKYSVQKNSLTVITRHFEDLTEDTLAKQCCDDTDFGAASFYFKDSLHYDAYRSKVSSCMYHKTDGDSCYHIKDVLFFIKNIGLIYRETGDGKEIWNLVDYKISD